MAAIRWISENLLLPLIVAIVGVVGGILITVRFAPGLTEWVKPATCSDPQDLVLVDKAKVEVTTSPTEKPPEGKDWSGRSLMDGDTASPWVPRRDTIDGATLTFSFNEPADLALICVVNGQPSSEVAYQNAGKVRSLAVTTDQNPETPRTSPLSVLSTEVMQQRQELNFDQGETNTVKLQVVSWYPGIAVFNPQQKRWSPQTGNIALAEIEFYRRP